MLLSPCGVTLQDPDDVGWEASFYMLLCLLCVFFGEVSVQVFCLFFKLGYSFACFLRILCIFWTVVPYQIRLCKCFLLVCGLSSHSLGSVFIEQKLLILIKTSLLTISVMDCAFLVFHLKSHCKP